MDPILHLREPIEAVSTDAAQHNLPINNTALKIAFRHPAYPHFLDQNIFLTLYAWDGTHRGLHVGTALLACSIVAANAEDGYLTTKGPDGMIRINAEEDTLLVNTEYWFHVPRPVEDLDTDEPYVYPLCPSFDDWVFPRDRLPRMWIDQRTPADSEQQPAVSPALSNVTSAVLTRDGRRCLLSQSGDYVERAHLCPRSELQWFKRNGMEAFNDSIDLPGDVLTDDLRNAITLRPDIHRAFDDRRFVILPKQGEWVPHFLDTTTDLGWLYHNRPFHIRSGISREFLLVRFAWAIFPKISHFFERGPPKKVKVLEETPSGLQQITKSLSQKEYLSRPGRRSRSSSPRKRKASDSCASPLPGITEAKRSCYSSLSALQTPLLVTDSHCSSQEDHKSFSLDDETERISALKRRARKAQRPTDLSLMCCDYNAAEYADAMNIPGPSKYGGGHLCWKCLGGEYELD